MSDPMSHEFSLQAPQDFEELGWVGVVCTLMVQVMMTSMSVWSL